MLRFFRQIRQRLLIENKFSKYLLYAVGEILLVGIGIRIALKVNDWQEDRIAKRFEMDLLEEIQLSIKENNEIFQRGVRLNKEGVQSCQWLLKHLRSESPYSDTLNFHFARSLVWYKAPSDLSAIETAKTYGLHNIENDSVRIYLTRVFERTVVILNTFEKRNHDYFHEIVAPVLTGLFKATDHGILMPPNYEYQGSMEPLEYVALKESDAYLHILESLAKNRNRDLVFFSRVLEEMNELDYRISTEIQRLRNRM